MPPTGQRSAVRGAGARFLTGLAAVLGYCTVLATPVAADTPGGDEAATVVVGVAGLRWTDVSPTATPTLWRLVGSSAVGSTQVRSAGSVTCPADGWLTLSAGVKATSRADVSDRDPLNPGQVAAAGTTSCDPIAPASSGQVPRWSEYQQAQQNLAGAYGTLGTLGDLLAGAGLCATAVGPGAALALAERDGEVARYSPSWSPTLTDACQVTVVDAGVLSESAMRHGQLAALDALVAEIVAAVPSGGHVIVTSVADPSASPPPLQVALQHVVGLEVPSWLSSASTRSELGIVALSDVTATVLARSGVPYDQLEGSPWLAGSPRDLTTPETVENRRDLEQLSAVIPGDGPAIGAGLAAVPAAVLLGCLLAVLARRQEHSWAARPLVSRAAIGAGLFGAALPPALYLVAATRWWEWDHPTAVLAVGTVVLALVLASLAAFAPVRFPWRFVVVLCGVTYAVLTVDGLAGTPLQAGSLLGAGPVYGGRFYGFGNVTFSVYATATLLLAAALAQALLPRSRRVAVAVASAVGGVAAVVDGWPAFGADFGGLIALVPGVVLLLLMVAGVRMTYTRLAAVGLTGVAAVTLVAWLDYLRPVDARSHMGDFFSRVLDGDAGEVLSSKVAALMTSLTSPLGWAELLAFALAVALVLRPGHVPALEAVFAAWPLLRPALLALALTCAVATFVNDSGALIAGLAVLTTAPLLIATCAWWAARPLPRSAQPPVAVARA